MNILIKLVLAAVLSVSSMCNQDIKIDKLLSFKAKGELVQFNDKYLITNDKGEISFYCPKTGAIEYVYSADYAFIYNAIVDENSIYFYTGYELARINIINKTCDSIFVPPKDEQGVSSKVFVYNGNLIFASNTYLYYVDKYSGGIRAKIENKGYPEILSGNKLYSVGVLRIAQYDCDKMSLSWTSNPIPELCTIILRTLNKNLFIDDNCLYFLNAYDCHTQSTFLTCISTIDGSLLWYKDLNGSVDYLELTDKTFYIVKTGSKPKLIKLSCIDQKIEDLVSLKSSNVFGIYDQRYVIYKYKENLLIQNIFDNDDVISYNLETKDARLYNDLLLIKSENTCDVYRIHK